MHLGSSGARLCAETPAVSVCKITLEVPNLEGALA